MEPCLLFCCFLGASQQRAEESPPFGEAPKSVKSLKTIAPLPRQSSKAANCNIRLSGVAALVQ